MALNPCLSQESSSANELLYLALSSKTLLILKKFYESVEYVQEIRPIESLSFLTAISFAIAVLEVAPKLAILAALSFAEHSCVMLSTEQH